MKHDDSHRQQDIEKFKFELAEELGIIEQTDRGKGNRNGEETKRPPRHRHVKRQK